MAALRAMVVAQSELVQRLIDTNARAASLPPTETDHVIKLAPRPVDIGLDINPRATIGHVYEAKVITVLAQAGWFDDKGVALRGLQQRGQMLIEEACKLFNAPTREWIHEHLSV